MSPVVCNAKYIKKFIKDLESKFPFPFKWIDKYTIGGLDVYENWLDEQKKLINMKRFFRKDLMERYNITEDEGV